MTRTTILYVTCLVFLASCADTVKVSGRQVFDHVEAVLVRDWCRAGALPELNPDNWPTCSTVTENDARRLGAHRSFVETQRKKNETSGFGAGSSSAE